MENQANEPEIVSEILTQRRREAENAEKSPKYYGKEKGQKVS